MAEGMMVLLGLLAFSVLVQKTEAKMGKDKK